MGLLDPPGVNPSTQPVIVAGFTQAAIDAAFTKAGTSRTVHFPAGVYSLTGKRSFTTSFSGSGVGITILRATGTWTDPMMIDFAPGTFDKHISDITFDAAAKPIQIWGSSDDAKGSSKGIYTSIEFQNTIPGIYAIGGASAIAGPGMLTGAKLTRLSFNNCAQWINCGNNQDDVSFDGVRGQMYAANRTTAYVIDVGGHNIEFVNTYILLGDNNFVSGGVRAIIRAGDGNTRWVNSFFEADSDDPNVTHIFHATDPNAALDIDNLRINILGTNLKAVVRHQVNGATGVRSVISFKGLTVDGQASLGTGHPAFLTLADIYVGAGVAGRSTQINVQGCDAASAIFSFGAASVGGADPVVRVSGTYRGRLYADSFSVSGGVAAPTALPSTAVTLLAPRVARRTIRPGVVTSQQATPMTTPPLTTNLGPNLATQVPNSVTYRTYGATNTDMLTAPPWRQWGYGSRQLTLRSAASPGGPYIFPYLASDPNSYGLGPIWRGWYTDATNMEYLYLSGGGQAHVRFWVDGVPVTASKVTLTVGGGNLWRYQMLFGLGGMAAPTLAGTTGGTLTNGGLYRYRVAAVDQNGGETIASAQASVTLGGGNTAITVTWTKPGENRGGTYTVTSYNVYRTLASAGTGTEQLLANIAAGTLTYTDTGAAFAGTTTPRTLFATSGRQTRRIEAEESFLYFGGLTLNKVDSLSPMPPRDIHACFLGDSITQGSGAQFLHWNFASQVCQLLGWDDPDIIGQGGTGYVAINAGQGTGTFISHATTDIIDPSVIIIAGGRNDVGQAAGVVQAAATTLFTTLRARYPGIPIIALAPWFSTGADVTAVGLEIKAAALACGIPYVDGIGELWTTGTGTVAAPTGVGNSDIVMGADQTHPTQNGHDYYARRAAQGIAAALS